MKRQGKPVATITLAVIQVAVFLLLSFGGMTEDAYYMAEHGALYVPYLLENGEYYRLFTSMFLHFGFSHLMNNMLSFLVFGWNLEPIIGPVRTVLIFLLSGLGGNVLSAFWDIIRQEYPVSAGASGAVFGMAGALLWLAIRNHGRVGTITQRGMFLMIGISLYLGFSGENVNNVAHIGGLLSGFFVGLILCWKRHAEHTSFTEYR